MKKIIHLRLSWSVSRGNDTYGYNICRLDDSETGKRYRTTGGGYDMVGTVFGDWLADTYQNELLALSNDAYYVSDKNGLNTSNKTKSFYGMYFYPEKNKITLDGGCGLESMIKIAEAIGLEVEREYKRSGRGRGDTLGWFLQMSDKKSV